MSNVIPMLAGEDQPIPPLVTLTDALADLDWFGRTDVKPKRVPYRSYAEICDALRANGIDPEVMERAMMPKFITDQKTIDVTAEEPVAEGGEPK